MVELWSTILTQKYDPHPKIFNMVAILHLNEVSSIVRGVKSMSAEMNTQAYGSSFLIPHTYPGRLIAAEGLDGSGKSTQLHLLQFWLQAEGYEVLSTELTASKLIKRALKAGKKQGSMDPMLLSILDAYEHMIDTAPYELLRLDAMLSVKQQQRLLREAVEKVLPNE